MAMLAGRSVLFSYLQFSALAARFVRSALKEEAKKQAAKRVGGTLNMRFYEKGQVISASHWLWRKVSIWCIAGPQVLKEARAVHAHAHTKHGIEHSKQTLRIGITVVAERCLNRRGCILRLCSQTMQVGQGLCPHDLPVIKEVEGQGFGATIQQQSHANARRVTIASTPSNLKVTGGDQRRACRPLSVSASGGGLDLHTAIQLKCLQLCGALGLHRLFEQNGHHPRRQVRATSQIRHILSPAFQDSPCMIRLHLWRIAETNRKK
ncbi:uncharacterized protein MONBRDRAFT_36901 [Monosiga brevicollis MX1]|uniref:Uncharacterized protein n=1 Tax=Monosiga brevicollis TaxID=81824 RepID=A9UXM4_MONBE|nr:uncharacterized protein MONBRDRAFT_36901 [Monosiga brevicollis MX1]EDQ89867.1 predicted protein [Monosiga brevicollis MX1]|eukprot:XP_001745289.1 hypothetical protein [Monosiga brevicollis MX1]